MNTKYTFLIRGAGPTGLLLALTLSKLDAKIYLIDIFTKEKLTSKDKTYAITHSTKRILEKFKLWDYIEPHIFGFNSLSISDSVISKNTILKINDLDKDLKKTNNIGWVVSHSLLTKIIFKELDKYKNVSFHLASNFLYQNKCFDYEFIADGANSQFRKNLAVPFFKKAYNQSCLTFKVFLRGNVPLRAYEVFREEGPLALLPLGKNFYQVIWTSSSLKSKERLNLSRNFLLDNLSAILPDNFKIDQIVGDLNVFPVSLSFTFPSLRSNKTIFVGDAFHTFHPVGGQGLNACWRDVNEIHNLLYLNKNFSLKSLKMKYFLNRLLDIFSLFIVTDSLIRIFANNNIFLLPFRKASFVLLNRVYFLRRKLLNYMTKSINYSSIK